ncbi:AraC family transcriptional regulator [Bacillus sp. KH172YL63]|uniref:AraC family transcriptional regulator n=1 Tax=Bacillus sp. KH172YL63 TaxID=2709784 RepID=UPI0013E4D7C1|nr:AraC family ligand binding domain-containing protein [Bacillus sp. KH172YL63]BCB04158.1 AraC family transcriptional regulator [Bacillus sp. KH172YL63]
MDTFTYRKGAGITALSATMTDFSYKKHAHREYAIGVTLRGIQHYHLDGSLHLSHPKGVMLFNPEQAHDGMAHTEEGLQYVMLYIPPELLLEATGRKELIRFSVPLVYDSTIERRIVTLAEAILSGQDEALCNEYFLSLTDRLSETNLTFPDKKDSGLIGKAKDMMQGSLEGVLKLDEISAELEMSKFKFIRLFKQHTGVSPYQYFLNGKVERAKGLIEQERDIYSAVAQCGFVDLAHLNKHFKSVYGTTAFEYMSHISHKACRR